MFILNGDIQVMVYVRLRLRSDHAKEDKNTGKFKVATLKETKLIPRKRMLASDWSTLDHVSNI